MAQRRSSARILAPLALIVAAAAIVLVVATSGTGSGPRADGAAAGRPSRAPARAPRFYIVRPGDILSSIADRTGVPLSRIEQLNPALDPQALREGQRVRLRQ